MVVLYFWGREMMGLFVYEFSLGWNFYSYMGIVAYFIIFSVARFSGFFNEIFDCIAE